MSVPVWKQTIIARRKQQEEAEKKKQQEKEQYLASLPPWKRAILKKKEGDAATQSAKEIKDNSPLVKPKHAQPWKQPTRTRKDSSEKDESPMLSKKPFENSIEITEKKGIAQSMKGKFEQTTSQAKVETVKQPVVKIQPTKQQTEVQPAVKQLTLQPSIQKPVEDIREPRKSPSEERKTIVQASSTGTQKDSLKPSQRRVSLVQAQAQSFDSITVGDDRFNSMPKWKQDLIIRKKQQQQQKQQQKSSETVSPKTSPSIEHKKQPTGDSNRSPVKSISFQWSSTLSSPVSKTPPVSFTQTSPKITEPPKTTEPPKEDKSPKVVPEVVNASNKTEPDSPKLLHKEGKELKPPVYQVKNKWADLDENDPEFKSLPEWKRTLILRRKNDFKNRTAPPKKEEKEKPKEEEKNEPLPTPLWTPTRSVTVRETPKEVEKVEEVNPLMDMRKNLRKVKRHEPPKEERKEAISQPLNLLNRKTKPEEKEDEESITPLKSPQKLDKKPKKLRRVSWSDTDLRQNLTVEFTYPKYSYEDYFDIDQDSPEELNEEKGNEEVDSGELATPLHPWLSSPPSNSTTSSSNSSSTSQTSNFSSGASSLSSSGMSSSFGSPSSFGMSSMGFGSADNFMSAYTGGLTTSNTLSAASSSSSSEKKVEQVKQNPIVEDIENDTAALIW